MFHGYSGPTYKAERIQIVERIKLRFNTSLRLWKKSDYINYMNEHKSFTE